MLVSYNNSKWRLDMSFAAFKSVQKDRPNAMVIITEETGSSYKNEKSVQIGLLRDVSEERNLFALGRLDLLAN